MTTLSPSLFTNTQSFFAPALTHVLAPSLFTNTQTFHAPVITQEARPAAGSRRGRRIAYEPLLDISIRAGEVMLFRGRSKRRPPMFNEHRRGRRVVSVRQRAQISSASLAAQFSYTGGTTGAESWPSDDPKLPPTPEA